MPHNTSSVTALPPITAIQEYGLSSTDISAYNACLGFEKSAAPDTEELIYARMLGYLIIYSPSVAARQQITNAILSYEEDHSKMQSLGRAFFNDFIRPFMKIKFMLSASYDDMSSEERKVLKEVKNLALIRDGFRCVVSGVYDRLSLSQISASADEAQKAGVVYTQPAHIIPSFQFLDTVSGLKPDPYTKTVVAFLNHSVRELKKLKGDELHNLRNLVTMQADIQEYFTRLDIWFEKTNLENHYKVKSIDPFVQVPQQKEVTFTTTDAEKMPIPSEELLVLHATCARVAQFSGAAELMMENDDNDN